MIPSASKSSPASFAFITQFKVKMKVKMMKVLDRCSLEQEQGVHLERFIAFCPECYVLALSFSESDQIARHHGLWSWQFWCSLAESGAERGFKNFELFMWFLPLTQLLLRVLKKQQSLQEHQVSKWFISSQTLIFNPGVGINSIALGFRPAGLDRLQWNSIAKGPALPLTFSLFY